MENAAVCTLFEGDYHYGLGALANSLFRHGFKGVIWAGYRGSLPPWAARISAHERFEEFKVGDRQSIRFVRLDTSFHLTNYKPHFIYFDPDIVIKCRWSFFEEWVNFGIALVEEIVLSAMPANHPLRLRWKVFGESLGLKQMRELNQYFNAGFIGIKREWKDSITLWRSMLEAVFERESKNPELFMTGERSEPFVFDQDVLNMALMFTAHPLSTIGPEGMDFVHGGFTMSHAAGGVKPWRKHFLRQAFRGIPPSAADKSFWRHVDGPITIFSKSKILRSRLALKLGAALGRVVARR
jgi:lipopolysaccharide biosynthesis glycosyltransferase